MARPNPLDDPTRSPFDVAREAAARIRTITDIETFDVALSLGSGWDSSIDELGEVTHSIPAREIPGFATPAVAGHSPLIRSVRAHSGKSLIILGARRHLYDGGGVRHVAHGARVSAHLGASVFVVTNASGGIRHDWAPGTPVLISDHINFTGTSPIEGAHFVDMSDAYSTRLRALAQEVDPSLEEGVYFGVRGPQYETPAEIRAANTLGADLVGMSTVTDVIAAREAGMEVLGLALVTNRAAGTSSEVLTHDAVLAAGLAATPRISSLLTGIVSRL